MKALLRALGTLGLAGVLVGCGSGSSPTPPGDGEHAPVPTGAVSFEKVALSADHRSVQVEFIGGREFTADDPCSVAYHGTAEIVGEVLEIGIYADQHPATLPPGGACTAEGYLRTLTLQLDEPFNGTLVRDLGGVTHTIDQPSTKPSPSHAAADVEGVFMGDLALGAPCSWVSGTDGIAWEIWDLPDGYAIHFEGTQEPVLVGPDGAVVARAGDRLGLNGTKDPPDVGSVCMVGRVLFVTDVVFAEPR